MDMDQEFIKSERKNQVIVKYNGQKLRYIKDFHGREVLWIMMPEQTKMPGMTFVGGYPDEYCIFLDELSEIEQAKIRKQLELLELARMTIRQSNEERTWNSKLWSGVLSVLRK